MEKTLEQEISQYLYPFIGNGCYGNKDFYNKLIKKYGKKTVLKTIEELREKKEMLEVFN